MLTIISATYLIHLIRQYTFWTLLHGSTEQCCSRTTAADDSIKFSVYCLAILLSNFFLFFFFLMMALKGKNKQTTNNKHTELEPRVIKQTNTHLPHWQARINFK